MDMSGYQVGIGIATGYFAIDKGKRFLFVRNIDRFYCDQIAMVSKYEVYQSNHFLARDRKPQYAIKARDISSLPDINAISDVRGFCRAYIEIHGVIDLNWYKNRRGIRCQRLRLRIFGMKDILAMINKSLPAPEKKMQHIKNAVGDYVGETSAIYFQSRSEIENIISWLDGHPRNEAIWEKWSDAMKAPSNEEASGSLLRHFCSIQNEHKKNNRKMSKN